MKIDQIPEKIPNIPDDIQEALKERMKDQYEFLYNGEGEPVYARNYGNEQKHLVRCKKTGNIYGGLTGFYVLGYRDHLTDSEQRYVNGCQSARIESSRFEKAKKVKYADYKFDGQYYLYDRYYPEWDYFIDEFIEEYGFNFDEWPKYIWPAPEKPYIKSKDAYRVYEDDMDRLSDECEWTVSGVKELQEALDIFVEVNEKHTACYPDYSVAVMIDDEIENYRKEHEEE